MLAEKDGGKLMVRDQKEAGRALISVSPRVNVHLGCASQRNEVTVVQEARRCGIGSTPVLILEEVRHIHTVLHQDTRRNSSDVCCPHRGQF